MASTPSTLKKEKKDESFFDKIGGTLARKKKAKEGGNTSNNKISLKQYLKHYGL